MGEVRHSLDSGGRPTDPAHEVFPWRVRYERVERPRFARCPSGRSWPARRSEEWDIGHQGPPLVAGPSGAGSRNAGLVRSWFRIFPGVRFNVNIPPVARSSMSPRTL